MTEIYRKFDVHFSKAEIQEILADRAKRLVSKRGDVREIDEIRVAHVEGGAVVSLTIWPDDVRKEMKQRAKSDDA